MNSWPDMAMIGVSIVFITESNAHAPTHEQVVFIKLK